MNIFPNRWNKLILLQMLIAICGVLLLLTIPNHASAQVLDDPIPEAQACDYSAYLARYGESSSYFIIRCLEVRLKDFSLNMINGLVTLIQPIITPLCTLAIALLAIRVTLLGGGSRPLGETFVVLMKILILFAAFIPGESGLIVEYMQYILDTVPEAVSLVMDAGASNFTSLESGTMLCANAGGDAPVPRVEGGMAGLFYRFDCMFNRVIGLESFTVMGFLTCSMALLVYGLFFTGPVGAAVALAVISYVLLYLCTIGQVLLYTVTIYVTQALLFGIAPVILPFWLFGSPQGALQNMVRVWFANVITYIILPMFLAAYMMLMQIMLFASSAEFYRPSKDGEADVYNTIQQAPSKDIFQDFIKVPNTIFPTNSATQDAVNAAKQHLKEYEDALANATSMADLQRTIKCSSLLNCTNKVANTAFDSAKQILVGIFDDGTEIANSAASKIAAMATTLAARATLTGALVIRRVEATLTDIWRFFALVLANIVLLSILLAYSKRLLRDVASMVGKGAIVGPSTQFAEGAYNISNRFTNTLSTLTPYGKYV